MSIGNYVLSGKRSKTSTHVRGISGMLNWSRARYTERADGCFTPDRIRDRLYSDGFLNLSRITWRESSRRKTRWWRRRVTRHAPDFTSESRRFDHSASSLRINQPLCRLGHVKWRNCASGILFDVRRPIGGSIGRASVNSTEDSTRRAENREAEYIGIDTMRHPKGRYRELSTVIVTF